MDSSTNTTTALPPVELAALRVAVIADDEISRRRICDVLAASGVETSEHVEDGDAVVVTDVGPQLAVAGRVAELVEQSEVPVVVVAADDRQAAVQAALRAGASAFVPFAEADRVLEPSLQAVAVGQLAVPLQRRSTAIRHPLTAREKQTLALVIMGLTNGEIAGKLFLAESTVKSHLSSAFTKLGVKSRNEAAALILDPRAGVGTGILTIPTSDPASQ